MSPEQLRGMKVDGRADIWSLGVVAYEMIAGHPPFNGLTKSDVIAAILRQEPVQITRYAADVPQELQRIVAKSLRKDRDERYQIAKDLLIDLKDLRQDLQLDVRQDRIRMSDPIRDATADDELVQTRGYTNRIEPARRTSGAHYLFDEIRQHRVGVTVTALSTILLLAAVVSYSWFYGRHSVSKAGFSSGPPSTTEIMTTSNVREGTISPDGKYIAIVVEDAGKQSIKIQQPYNPGEAPVIADGGEYRGLVFSRDGTSVFYLARDEKGSALYQVSTLGGAARKLLTNIETPITLSPDGTQLAFVRRNSGGTVLITAKADGTAERELATATGQFEFSTFRPNSGPAWSPDGKVIACPTMTVGDPMYMEVVAARVDDGSVKPMSSQRWFLIGQLGWLSDGSGLIMAAQEKTPPQTTPQIWSVTYPGGEARALTSDVGLYQGIGLTADSATLLTTRTNQTSKIWIASVSQPDDAEELPASKNKGSGGLVWTPDGNLVYASNESGTMEIWTTNAKGSDVRQNDLRQARLC